MRNFYKTSLIVTLAGVLFLNEGAAFAFEFKNPFKRNRAKVEKKKTEEPVQNTEENLSRVFISMTKITLHQMTLKQFILRMLKFTATTLLKQAL